MSDPAIGAVDTFIVVHDQDLVLECEREGRFEALARHTYLFVGPREVSRLAGLDHVVVARELPDNIEEHLHLVSFTGWYAVARNGLARAPWVTLLEYDVAVSPDFPRATMAALGTGRRLVGYVPFPLSHPMYLYATPWLIPSLGTVHGIDVQRLIAGHLRSGGVDTWTATTNASMATADLHAFVEWFVPLSRLFRHDPIGAHVHERTLPIFCLLNGLDNVVVPGVLEHRQQRSHGIRARSWDEAQAEADRSGWPLGPS